MLKSLFVYIRMFVSVRFCIIQELHHSAKAEVQEAIKYSLEGSDLPPQELYTDVYTDQVEDNLFIRGVDPFTNNKSY